MELDQNKEEDKEKDESKKVSPELYQNEIESQLEAADNLISIENEHQLDSNSTLLRPDTHINIISDVKFNESTMLSQ